jgi:osmotically-inducible protein OsmY
MLGMATNQMPGSNNSTTANTNNNFLQRDIAVTASDRTLLVTLKETVSVQLGITSRGALPVHFLISSGAVTLVGTVSTADESQRILARVQQTPGVLSVFNDLQVGTTSPTALSQSSILGAMTDHAFSPADQSLLTAVQQAAGMQLGINGASAAQMPVHFSIENGVVGVTGRVSSLQEKQALLAAVQRTTGVVRVVDNVAIADVAAGGVNSANGNQMNNSNLPATSRDLNQSNSMFLNSTNSSGL